MFSQELKTKKIGMVAGHGREPQLSYCWFAKLNVAMIIIDRYKNFKLLMADAFSQTNFEIKRNRFVL